MRHSAQGWFSRYKKYEDEFDERIHAMVRLLPPGPQEQHGDGTGCFKVDLRAQLDLTPNRAIKDGESTSPTAQALAKGPYVGDRRGDSHPLASDQEWSHLEPGQWDSFYRRSTHLPVRNKAVRAPALPGQIEFLVVEPSTFRPIGA